MAIQTWEKHTVQELDESVPVQSEYAVIWVIICKKWSKIWKRPEIDLGNMKDNMKE